MTINCFQKKMIAFESLANLAKLLLDGWIFVVQAAIFAERYASKDGSKIANGNAIDHASITNHHSILKSNSWKQISCPSSSRRCRPKKFQWACSGQLCPWHLPCIYPIFGWWIAKSEGVYCKYCISKSPKLHGFVMFLLAVQLSFLFNLQPIFLGKNSQSAALCPSTSFASRVERNGFKIEWLLAQNAKTSTDGDGRMMVGKASITSKNSSWVKERNLKNRTTAREKDPKPVGNETVLRD